MPAGRMHAPAALCCRHSCCCRSHPCCRSHSLLAATATTLCLLPPLGCLSHHSALPTLGSPRLLARTPLHISWAPSGLSTSSAPGAPLAVRRHRLLLTPRAEHTAPSRLTACHGPRAASLRAVGAQLDEPFIHPLQCGLSSALSPLISAQLDEPFIHPLQCGLVQLWHRLVQLWHRLVQLWHRLLR